MRSEKEWGSNRQCPMDTSEKVSCSQGFSVFSSEYLAKESVN